MKKYELIVDGKSILETDDVIELEKFIKVCKLSDSRILKNLFKDLEQIFSQFNDLDKLYLGNICYNTFTDNYTLDNNKEYIKYIYNNYLLCFSQDECEAIVALFSYTDLENSDYRVFARKNCDGNIGINIE